MWQKSKPSAVYIPDLFGNLVTLVIGHVCIFQLWEISQINMFVGKTL